MSTKKIELNKEELDRLYYKEKKSKYKIGEIYGCSFKTVLNRMRELGMKPLSRSIIQNRYDKKNFSNDKTEKAYLIGFRLGDLNVYKRTDNSEFIVVRCHTTCAPQVQLMRRLFKQYGQVSVLKSIRTNSYHINCYLDKSFDFLLPKDAEVAGWIKKNNKYATAFAAGYIDAEGNAGVYDGRARLKIDSYDKEIIFWLYEWFLKNMIICPKPIRIGKKNQIYNKKYKYSSDLWRIRVSEKKSLLKLFKLIYGQLRHAKRKSDFRKCLKNINDRNNTE